MKILFVREPKGIDAIELATGRLRVEMAAGEGPLSRLGKVFGSAKNKVIPLGQRLGRR
jgi:hypothetical protein